MGDPVTKLTKSSVKVRKAVESKEDEPESEVIGFNAFVEGNILSPSRFCHSKTKAEVADQIGRGLRSVYNNVLSQPVPDRFLDLLRRLEGEQSGQLKKDAL
jgi:Anti-sigma factor NepR